MFTDVYLFAGALTRFERDFKRNTFKRETFDAYTHGMYLFRYDFIPLRWSRARARAKGGREEMVNSQKNSAFDMSSVFYIFYRY